MVTLARLPTRPGNTRFAFWGYHQTWTKIGQPKGEKVGFRELSRNSKSKNNTPKSQATTHLRATIYVLIILGATNSTTPKMMLVTYLNPQTGDGWFLYAFVPSKTQVLPHFPPDPTATRNLGGHRFFRSITVCVLVQKKVTHFHSRKI